LSLHGAALITLIIKSRDCLEKCDVSLGSVEQYLVHTTTDSALWSPTFWKYVLTLLHVTRG
jgi:hypothetical protein